MSAPAQHSVMKGLAEEAVKELQDLAGQSVKELATAFEERGRGDTTPEERVPRAAAADPAGPAAQRGRPEIPAVALAQAFDEVAERRSPSRPFWDSDPTRPEPEAEPLVLGEQPDSADEPAPVPVGAHCALPWAFAWVHFPHSPIS